MSWESPQVECASPGWLPSTTLEGVLPGGVGNFSAVAQASCPGSPGDTAGMRWSGQLGWGASCCYTWTEVGPHDPIPPGEGTVVATSMFSRRLRPGSLPPGQPDGSSFEDRQEHLA